MDRFIHIMAIVLIVGYIVFSIWFIFRRRAVWSSIGSSAGLLTGGFFLTKFAEVISSVVCWGIVAVLLLLVIAVIVD